MQPIQTHKAPSAVGPYSQAYLAQGFLFVSGQIPISPETNTLELFDGDIAKQARLVLSNLLAILEAAGCTKNEVVKTTILLTDINDFAVVNAVYSEFFGDHKPARATYAVAALPKGANLEIEAIACCTATPP
jgi:2-iminobutanoate/2-iminopropanoate deaminase